MRHAFPALHLLPFSYLSLFSIPSPSILTPLTYSHSLTTLMTTTTMSSQFNNQTAFHKAAEAGHVGVVKIILQQGVKIDAIQQVSTASYPCSCPCLSGRYLNSSAPFLCIYLCALAMRLPTLFLYAMIPYTFLYCMHVLTSF